MVLCSTGLSYMWFGRFPLWLWAAGAAGVLLLFPRGMASFHSFLRQAGSRIILPWCVFIVFIFVRDLLDGGLNASLADRAALTGATLVLFCVCACLAHRCDWRHVLIVLGVIGFLFGLVALGQFSGSYALWTLPDAIAAYSSKDAALEANLSAAVTAEDILAGFSRVGRARGIDLYVHKFAAYQGIIVGITVAATIIAWQTARRHWITMMLVTVCALVATLGMVVTFSRAPLLGVLVAAGYVLFFARKQQSLVPLISMALFAVALGVVFAGLRLSQADQFQRIFEFDTQGSADAGRIITWLYSLQLFLQSPLIGAGSSGMNAAELVTHNVPLRILGDFGLLGFIPYAFVWWALLNLGWRVSQVRSPGVATIGVIVMSGLLIAMIDNMTHSSGLLQRDTSQAAVLGVCYGLCLTALQNARSVVPSLPPSPPRASPPWRGSDHPPSMRSR